MLLDPARVPVALVAAGADGQARWQWLVEAGARPEVYAPAGDLTTPLETLVAPYQRLPSAAEIACQSLLFIAGLPPADSAALAASARAARVLVHVDDVKPLCDFHLPALVRRGDLLVTVSTGGRAPGLARLLRRQLERWFPADWGERLGQLAVERERLRALGADRGVVNRALEALLEGEWRRPEEGKRQRGPEGPL